MEKNEVLIKAALLHDIGKICYRADKTYGEHSSGGAKFLEQFLDDSMASKQILRCLKYHHAKHLQSAHLSEDDLSYIVYEADNIASGLDRRSINDTQGNFEIDLPLGSVFNIFSPQSQPKECMSYFLRPFNVDDKFNYAQKETVYATADKYQSILDEFISNFKRANIMDMSVNELLRILEDLTSFIPSSTNKSEVADISLYMHTKVTAAVASCMKQYFDANSVASLKEKCFSSASNFRDEKAFLLVSGDISGIQNFIYTIPSKGALKSLRGRSFYLEILLENFVDELLEQLGLSRANLLYTGGGHFYLLAGANTEVKNYIEALNDKFNKWLLQNFGTKLYLAMGYAECTANDLLDSGKTESIFSIVSRKIAINKMQRYNHDDLELLFSHESKYNVLQDNSRECSICHSSEMDLQEHDEWDGPVCDNCHNLFVLGSTILDKEIVFVISQEYGTNALKLFGSKNDLWLYAVEVNKIQAFTHSIERIYCKNKSLTGYSLATRLWLVDYVYHDDKKNILSFEELATASGYGKQGIKRLGVLRADVDNLGAAFIAGFISDNDIDKHKYATISRQAELSRNLSTFFKFVINKICGGELPAGCKQFKIFANDKGGARKVHVVYAGGDDMFLVGAWDELLELAVDINNAFRVFTNNKLTFSAGLALFSPSYPISKMAELTGLLEDAAKARPEKNSLALFGMETNLVHDEQKLSCKHVYAWDDFVQHVCGEKLNLLLEAFSFEKDSSTRMDGGKSLLYRLMGLIESVEDDKINLARFAYTLARLEPNTDSEPLKENYRRFEAAMYKWIKNAKDRQELLTAITLVVYYLRESGEK